MNLKEAESEREEENVRTSDDIQQRSINNGEGTFLFQILHAITTCKLQLQ